MQHVKPLTDLDRAIIKAVRELIIYHPSLFRKAGDWFYTVYAMDEIDRRNHPDDEEWIANEHLDASIPRHRLMACIKDLHDDPSEFCTMRRSNAEQVAARIVYVVWLVSDPNASVVAPGFGDIELAPWDESGLTPLCRWWASMDTRTTFGYGFAAGAIKVMRAKAGYAGETTLDALIAEAVKREKRVKETAELERQLHLITELRKTDGIVNPKPDVDATPKAKVIPPMVEKSVETEMGGDPPEIISTPVVIERYHVRPKTLTRYRAGKYPGKNLTDCREENHAKNAVGLFRVDELDRYFTHKANEGK